MGSDRGVEAFVPTHATREALGHALGGHGLLAERDEHLGDVTIRERCQRDVAGTRAVVAAHDRCVRRDPREAVEEDLELATTDHIRQVCEQDLGLA